MIRLVDEDFTGRGGGGIDDFRDESVEADALFLVLAEEQRLAGFEREHLVVAVFLGVNRIPGGIVEDHAVLEDFDKRDALVRVGGLEGFHHVLRVVVDGAGDEGRFRAEREEQGIERMVDRTGGRGLGLGALGEVGLYWPLVRP